MFTNNTFQDLLKLFPQDILQSSVKKHKGDKYTKSFSCYNQLVSMIYAQLSGMSSLREIIVGYNQQTNSHYHLKTGKISRSTLSDANANRNYKIFLEPLNYLMNQLNRKQRNEFGEIIRIVDSSPIQLKGRHFNDWTDENKSNRIQGLKLHTEYDPNSTFVTNITFSAPNINDITEFKNWQLDQYTIYVLDKGYCDYNFWWKMHQNNIYFVTRLKSNSAINIEVKHDVSDEMKEAGIISDEAIILSSKSHKKTLYSEKLRRIVVARPDKDTPLILVTNRFDLSALQVAELYKQRWSIELLFKWLKQRLNIKKFVGTSKNAVIIQIVTAITTYILLILLKKAQNCKISTHLFLITVRTNLFERKKINYYQKNKRIY